MTPMKRISVTIAMLSSLVSEHATSAFVRNNLCHDVSKTFSSLNAAAPDDNEEALDNDAEFYRDLRKAKTEMLGRSIPPEQARASAVEAEGYFLRAMRETKDEFEKAKEELGSDGAVDLFLDRIREEDERNEEGS